MKNLVTIVLLLSMIFPFQVFSNEQQTTLEEELLNLLSLVQEQKLYIDNLTKSLNLQTDELESLKALYQDLTTTYQDLELLHKDLVSFSNNQALTIQQLQTLIEEWQNKYNALLTSYDQTMESLQNQVEKIEKRLKTFQTLSGVFIVITVVETLVIILLAK